MQQKLLNYLAAAYRRRDTFAVSVLLTRLNRLGLTQDQIIEKLIKGIDNE